MNITYQRSVNYKKKYYVFKWKPEILFFRKKKYLQKLT